MKEKMLNAQCSMLIEGRKKEGKDKAGIPLLGELVGSTRELGGKCNEGCRKVDARYNEG
jgi:hypothetical protein